MAMPACPECGTTLTFLVCGSGDHPTLYRCMLCRALFLGIESASRRPTPLSGHGHDGLSQPAQGAVSDATRV